MSTRTETGRAGEAAARKYLEKRGYTILAANWRTGRLEVDIIARKGSTTVFVEVKLRTGDDYGNPEDFVDDEKQERLMEAAEEWMENNETEGIRFDIIAVDGTSKEIYHIEDAFS